MDIVVLGGTGFLSAHVVAAGLARGHRIITVTRGRREGPVTAATAVHADRDDAAALAAALDGRVVDAVIDVCGYTVAGAHAAAEVLADVPAYACVSSVSAYAGWPPGPVRGEADPTFGPDADPTEYGPMKAESERVLGAVLGDRLLIARAGLIIGPGDRTRRLTGWLHRIATRPRVVVPAELDQPVAFVDARDLASWLVDGVEHRWSGPVTATGPAGMTTYGGMLEACRTAVAGAGGRPAELVPVAEAELLGAGVEPWTDLPFWLPADVARTAWDVDTTRARELGLPTRPVTESVADAWRWVQQTGFEHPDPPAVLERWA